MVWKYSIYLSTGIWETINKRVRCHQTRCNHRSRKKFTVLLKNTSEVLILARALKKKLCDREYKFASFLPSNFCIDLCQNLHRQNHGPCILNQFVWRAAELIFLPSLFIKQVTGKQPVRTQNFKSGNNISQQFSSINHLPDCPVCRLLSSFTASLPQPYLVTEVAEQEHKIIRWLEEHLTGLFICWLH